MEFPAVSHTRIEFWKKPQYTRTGMWWFTLLFGIFGLHHLMLRSPQTALIFLIANVLTLGYPWFYDLIQLSSPSTGGLGTDKLNQFGMGHPWGPLGLAQGMWLPDDAPPSKSGPSDPPSPWWFVIYCFCIPVSIASNLVAGDTNNAFSRFLMLTVVPLGFLFYGCAIVYDYWCLLSSPADLVFNGTRRFFPFPSLGWDNTGHSPRITGHAEFKKCPRENIITAAVKTTLPVVRYLNPSLADTIDGAIRVAENVKEETINTGKQVVDTAIKVGHLAEEIPSAAAKPLAAASAAIASPANLASLARPARRNNTAPSPASPASPASSAEPHTSQGPLIYNKKNSPPAAAAAAAAPAAAPSRNTTSPSHVENAAPSNARAVRGAERPDA